MTPPRTRAETDVQNAALEDASAAYSVVIPARNAERTLARVLRSLAGQAPAPEEILVVDDGSSDGTSEIARQHGARVIPPGGRASAGGSRNQGWSASRSEIVVFLDADAIPEADWGAGVARAAGEFPGAIVGCARTFGGDTAWEWVSHLQIETPYLPRGEPRDVPFVSSFCMIVPRDLPIRFDESYGGEDAVFCAEALAAGVRLVFDPRFCAYHDHGRTTFHDLRRQQARLARGLARCGPIQREGLHKRVFSRVPLHYFALVRLPIIYRRVRANDALRRRFVRLLPRMVIAEWALGLSALRYVARRPSLDGVPASSGRLET
jgi:glycosyltransferase involved in cell wall biosynthesis